MASPSKPKHDLNCLSISELEAHAATRMDKQTRDYYNEGADNGSTLAENISAYQKYRIRPRVLRNVSIVDSSVEVFGFRNSIPMGVAPSAMQGLAHPDGELATARACKKSDVVMGLSSFATNTLEDVAKECGDLPHVLQLYLFEERNHSIELLRRAKAAGFKAVALTVDTPILGRRNLEIRNQFKLPKHLKIANFPKEDGASDGAAAVLDGTSTGGPESSTAASPQTPEGQSSTSATTAPAMKAQGSIAGYQDGEKHVAPSGPITFHTHGANPTLSWENDIAWLKEECGDDMQVWLKGIATEEDALLAVHHGVDGIWVSNHGGRQLNGALATLDALPEIVRAVKGKIPIHVDGGIRHGSDIFKAIALGADFVWIGRPVLWGLAYKGQDGVELALKLLKDEFRLCMALAGVKSVAEIGKEYLVRMDRDGFASRL